MRLTPVLPLVAVLVLAGCSTLSGPRPGDAYASDVRTDPALMRAVPDAVAAGGKIDAVFPRATTRGPGFVLEQATDRGWAWWFAISSETNAPHTVNTFTAKEFTARNLVWTSGPAFDSTDPHRIPVPHDAEPGLWRVCTVPETPGLCAEFEITADGSPSSG